MKKIIAGLMVMVAVIIIVWGSNKTENIHAKETQFKYVNDVTKCGFTIDEDNISYNMNSVGQLEGITYQIRPSNIVNNIRYRVTEIAVKIDGYTYTLDSDDIAKVHPQNGEKIVSLIIISKDNILDSLDLAEKEKATISKRLDDTSNIKVTSKIEIYNVSTGEVLETFADKKDVKQIMQKYEFDQRDIENVLKRYKGYDSTLDK